MNLISFKMYLYDISLDMYIVLPPLYMEYKILYTNILLIDLNYNINLKEKYKDCIIIKIKINNNIFLYLPYINKNLSDKKCNKILNILYKQ